MVLWTRKQIQKADQKKDTIQIKRRDETGKMKLNKEIIKQFDNLTFKFFLPQFF